MVLQNSQNAGGLIFRRKTKQATIADRSRRQRATEVTYEFIVR